MPVTDTVIEESFDGNGSTTTPYPITIPRALDEDIKLKVDNVLTTAFSIAVDGIRTDVAVPSGTTVVAFRDTPLTQSQPFPSNTTPAAEDVRAGLDKVTLITQEISAATEKSLMAGPGETAPLGTVVKAADTTMGQDATGTMVNRTASEQIAFLNLPETVIDRPNKVWADDATRALAVPDYIGQDGHQIDTSLDYYATGLTAGDWTEKSFSGGLSVNNVVTFGATGDGVADDTTFIQAAIDDTTSNTIYFPKGDYKITTPLLLTRTGLTIIGDGVEATKITQATTGTNGFEQTATSTMRHVFKRFTLEGPENTGASIGFKMQLDAALDPNNWSGDHLWENVIVQKFGVGFHCRWNALVLFQRTNVLNCLKGWYMDRCDTPTWNACGASSNIGGANHMEVGIEVANGGFTGSITNGEWGNMQRVFDISGGQVHYTIFGGNIEDSINDGVIYLGQNVRATIKNVRFSIDTPTVADSAIIICDASGSSPAILELGECSWDDGDLWRRIVVRGPNYYQARVNNCSRTQVTYESGTGTGGTVVLSSEFPTIRQWPQTQWQSAATNSESRNATNRGRIAMMNINDTTTGQFEHPVVFYRDRNGAHQASSLSNDRLTDVLLTQHTQAGNVSTTRTVVVDYTLPANRTAGGETVTMTASGTFAANANNKKIRIHFSNVDRFDTGNLTHNAKDWSLTSTLIRQVHNLVMTTTLLVDGANPIVQVTYPTSEFANAAHDLDLVFDAVSTDDITCEQAEIVWRKAQGAE